MQNSALPSLTPAFDPRREICPLCRGGGLAHSRTDYTGVHIDRCRDCGAEFMNPPYTDDFLQAFYEQYQRDLATTHRFGDDPKPRKLIHNYNLAQIETFRPPGRLLSVGCGKGVDLQVAAARGWAPEGYDVDTEFVQAQSKKLELPIRSGDFCALAYDEADFDCVYLNHVLEHPKRPGDYLAKIATLLAPGGILYIACPNLGSPSSRLKNYQDALGLRARPAKHYDAWQHLSYFTPRRLGRVLEHTYGLDVLYRGSDIKARRGDNRVRAAPMARLCLKSTFRLLARRPG